MSQRHLTLDDLRTLNSPENIASIFHRLGYDAIAQSLNITDLDLSSRNSEVITDTYLIADQGNGGLQVILFQLKPDEWLSPSYVSSRMKSIATQLGRRTTEFLLLATKDYNQLMLVNPRKSFDETYNLQCSIRKLLIDRTNPTAYDLDRLEAIAVNNQSSEKLYQAHCEAFDVEKLTKEFYKGYRQLFERVQETFNKYNDIEYFENKDKLHQFCQRLLGRIMFLYFLQKKGFLNNDPKFLTTQYKLNHYSHDDSDYYREVLEPLFFEILNTPLEKRQHSPSPFGREGWRVRETLKIPYLNGGLFDLDYGENIKDSAGGDTPESIILPNFIFDCGDSNSILGFFNQYNFTISENITGDEDVAVDPEMLGKVFENMLVAEERGSSGTFYTPRGIVQFMASEVLTRYLIDALTPQTPNSGSPLTPNSGGIQEKKVPKLEDLGEETIQKLINYDPDLPDSEFNQLITPSQAREIKRAIASLKILDPAVGSGAFPLGMMQVILNVKQAVARREGMKVQRGSLTISQWKREIIANNLYGVDIKPEAIEIAKLRMWLSLVVDIPNIEDVEPLPNLDYKLMCGDSLISTIHGEVLIPPIVNSPLAPNSGGKQRKKVPKVGDLGAKTTQLMLAVTPIQIAIQPLLSLQQQYFNADSHERQELRKRIIDAENNVFKVAVGDRLQYLQGQLKEIELQISSLRRVTNTILKKKEEVETKITELSKFAHEVATGKRSLNFFQYHLHFRDVFEDKGGFDIVIGNPPYVRQEAIKDLKPALSQEYECYTGVADLYVYFYEQGLRLLKENGYLSYISSNKYFRAGYGEKLRNYLAHNSTIELLIDFGDANVFEAIAYPSIIVVKKQDPPQPPLERGKSDPPLPPLETEESNPPQPPLERGEKGVKEDLGGSNHQIKVLNWSSDKSLNEFNLVYEKESFLLPQKSLTGDGWRLESSAILNLLDKLKNAGIPLGEYVNGRFYYGIKTGFNEAFIVNQETRDKLINEHESSAEILKPFLRGKDVKKWIVNFAEQYLIKIESSENKKHLWSGAKTEKEAEKIFANTYPAIYKRFNEYRNQLVKRGDKGKYFWELRSCKYWQEFEQPKIVLSIFMDKSAFAFDKSGYYHNNALHLIAGADEYVTAVLNSACGWWFLKHICTDLQNGYLQAYKENLEQISIPKATEDEKKEIEKLVQKCLDNKGVSCEQWEAEINDIVARLYGLNEEDMMIIRGE